MPYDKHTSKCLENAGDDEPIFVLRARDELAPQLVLEWASVAYAAGTPRVKVMDARKVAAAMLEWSRINGCKVPD